MSRISEPWKGIPAVEQHSHPQSLADELKRRTGREILLRSYDQFLRDFRSRGKVPDDLMTYAVLTVWFPRCIKAVLDGMEQVTHTQQPLVLLARPFECKHALMALYDWHPVVAESAWNDGLYDHVRMWTWKQCEICEVKGSIPS